MILALLYFLIFLLCWILSIIIIQRECETDPGILKSRTSKVDILVKDYIKHEYDADILATIYDGDLCIKDECGLHEIEFRHLIGKTVRVNIETKFDGLFIIHPYFLLKDVVPKKNHKNYWY